MGMVPIPESSRSQRILQLDGQGVYGQEVVGMPSHVSFPTAPSGGRCRVADSEREGRDATDTYVSVHFIMCVWNPNAAKRLLHDAQLTDC